ncbi:GDP-mannose 4,6-dehydratase, partial [Pandoraea pneumonica]|uniref:GDP-mannose 4,6-dehydratase n=1 Tax=Pandoraea pneumonica TaxID=2508299 RepID=UPI003CEF674B
FDVHGRRVVAVDPRYFRPTEVETLLGDSTRAHKELGWEARTDFETLVREMVAADLKAAERESLLRQHGLHD